MEGASLGWLILLLLVMLQSFLCESLQLVCAVPIDARRLRPDDKKAIIDWIYSLQVQPVGEDSKFYVRFALVGEVCRAALRRVSSCLSPRPSNPNNQ